MAYTDNGIFCPEKEGKEILQFATTWMNPGDISLIGINQHEMTNIYYMIPLVWITWNSETHRSRE